MHAYLGVVELITQPHIERRRQPRVQLEASAAVRIVAPREHHTGLLNFSVADGYLFDLNNLGAFVATDLVIGKGSLVDLELQIPGIESPEGLQAKVARSAPRISGHGKIIPAGLGLRFVAHNPYECERIRRLVLTTLMLDLLRYGYEKRRTVSFWRDVLTATNISARDWRPPVDDVGNLYGGNDPYATLVDLPDPVTRELVLASL